MILGILLGFICLLILLILVAFVRTLFVKNKVSTYKSPRDQKREKEYAENLSKMIQCKTVSEKDQTDLTEFDKLHKVFEEIFPNIHKACEKN